VTESGQGVKNRCKKTSKKCKFFQIFSKKAAKNSKIFKIIQYFSTLFRPVFDVFSFISAVLFSFGFLQKIFFLEKWWVELLRFGSGSGRGGHKVGIELQGDDAPHPSIPGWAGSSPAPTRGLEGSAQNQRVLAPIPSR
jgi:hypothetical protein